MRIIYEDSEYREEREKLENAQAEKEFTDVSSMSDEYKRTLEEENAPDKPKRPAPTLRPEAQQPQAEAPAQQIPAQQPVPPQGYMGQPVYYPYPQGYPAQYVQYPQGYVYPAPYGAPPQQQNQGYQYPQMQGYPVQTAVPQPTAPQTAAPQPTNETGTRVIYQSPDFDNGEAAPKATPQIKPQPIFTGTTHDAAVQPRPVNPVPSGSFEVDDMEMSMFELNAMSHKYQSKSKAYTKPSQSSSFEVEDCEEEISFPEEKPAPVKEKKEEANVKSAKSKSKGKSKGKSKKKKRNEAIRRTVLAVSIVAIIVSGGFLVNEYRLSQMNSDLNDETNDLIIDVDDIYSDYQDAIILDETEGDDTAHELTEEEKQAAIAKKWEEIKKKYPNVEFPEGLKLEYANLYGENQDFVGFLKADGIGMSLPIVQTTNDDYYLKKDFHRRNTKYGTPFVTHLNTISEEKYGLDTNTVIFGHHMNDGSVFGILDEYKTIEGFKAAPVITFNTLYNDYQWKVIAAFVTNAEASDDNGYVFKYYFTDLSTEERFSAYLNSLSERSLYNTGVDVLPTDKILTLSTCSHEFDNARFVVVARMVRNGEVPEVDVSRATVNSNPRYPQAYYDKKKQDNPYKDAYRWEVG
ncbi:MAG: sortase [Clostridia bacterium]|nr:sortase [Clostridia bacterium]